MTIDTKKTIRQQLNQQRKQLTQQQKNELSAMICDKILSSPFFKKSKTIASYLSINNEVDLSCLFSRPKTFVLPVIQNNSTMVFNQYSASKNLIKNNFGILEPANNKTIQRTAIDLCLMPLVGFNRQGDRLGMGGGYYDRYFASNQLQNKPAILIGIAYDFQENATIQSQEWDIPLDIIFTNKEVIYCDQTR